MAKYASYILFLLITILVVILHLNGVGPLNSVQRSVDDFLTELVAPEGPRPNVVLVTIDPRAENEYGEWPWNRDLVADLLAATATGEPKSILVDFKLPEDAAQDSAGYTDILAKQLNWIDKAVLSYDIAPATFRTSKTNNPKFLFSNSIAVDNVLGEMREQSSLLVRKVFLPAHKLIAHKPYLGFDYDSPDTDRILRHQPLVMNYEGYYYPSQTLLSAAVFLGVPTDMITVDEGKEIRIGNKREIPINSSSEVFISYTKTPGYTRYSASDILSDDFDRGRLKGKMVLIGVDDPSTVETFSTAVSDAMSTLTIKANVLDNIINENLVSMTESSTALSLLVLFILGGAFAFMLPRVTLTNRMLFIGGALIVLINANYFMLTTFHLLPLTVYIALELLLFMAAAPLLDSQMLGAATEAQRKRKKEAAKKAKPAKRKSDTADTADTPVRELRASEHDQENLQTSAVDSKIAQETRATATSSDDKKYLFGKSDGNDTPEVIDHQTLGDSADGVAILDSNNSSREETDHQAISLNTASSSATSHADIISPNDSGSLSGASKSRQSSSSAKLFTAPNIRNLGRYQVKGVLGQGSMGLVYEGIDPAINRPVALKTIRLDFVNDPEEMEELKLRLFREAQAAGKLSHPNIVTIYDVGSEGHLQYIAMEYLEGQTLEDLIKKKVKFNYRIIAQIINQICAALEYAHERGIVHRDIKPANIMILGDYSVKVMDYGIARVDSNSMTKTGIAMGTPNYISPEQLRGGHIDNRSDLFSLGVVMYEMLLGRRPFRGENITQLIYAITNHEPEKPSRVNPEVPLLFDHIISKALKKNADERYQKASDIAHDLSDFVESFAH